MEKISGIYCILNLKNNKRYIGKSVNIYNRWTTEKSGLRNKYFHNIHLQRAWDKYGENTFDFFILERCQKDMLAEREQFWIDFYDSYNNGRLSDGTKLTWRYATFEEIDKLCGIA